MPNWLRPWLMAGACVLLSLSAQAQDGRNARLVDAAWLKDRLADVVLLDASATPQHQAGHIPGAVSADLYRYGPREPSRAVMEKRIQSWGVSGDRPIVIYDQGGDTMAPRLFYDLHYNGLPAERLHILDGGLNAWRAAGGAVVNTPTPAPAPGSYRITAVREEMRSRLPEFLGATGDRQRHAVVEALEPGYHYGGQKFFDRAGHVPNAKSMPSADFFNADKTFKSPDEIRRQLRYLGIQPDQVVHSHCGGGVAAAVPWFALQFLAGHRQTKLYLESQLEWLRDERGLPFWTYDAPQLLRDGAWVASWNAPMLRMFGAAAFNLIDVRPAEAYTQGHVPFAINLPADSLRSQLGRPEELAARLGPAGVNPAHEVVLMAESGLTPGAALAFLALDQLGHAKVSVLMDSVDEWALRGAELTPQPTTIGPPKSPKDFAVPAAVYTAQPRAGVLISDREATRGEYPKVYVASGASAPKRRPAGTLVSLPHTGLLKPDGTPKPAAILFDLITKAGVPRHAEVVLVADDVADAAVNYFIFRLMGWPDVKVMMN